MEVGEFLSQLEKLISKGEDEEAEQLVRDFAKGKENEIIEMVIDKGIEFGMAEKHNWALAYFELTKKVSRNRKFILMSTELAALAHYNIGVSFDLIHRSGEAENHFKIAINYKPDFAEAYNSYGHYLLVLGKMSKAKKMFIKAIQNKTGFSEAYNNLGLTLYQLGKKSDSEDCIKMAIFLKPNLIEAYNILGNILSENNIKEAEEIFKKAIKLKPDYIPTYANLGIHYSRNSKFEDAEYYYKEGLKYDPDDPVINGNFGFSLFESGRFKDAQQYFKNAQSMFTFIGIHEQSVLMDGYVFWIEARLLWDSKKWDDSKECYIIASKLIRKTKFKALSNFLKQMSKILFISRDYNDAINSESLGEVKQKIAKVFNNFSQILDPIKEIKILDFELVKAQFECIEVLNRALNFESYNEKVIENARISFKENEFTTPLFAINSLENFVTKLKKYKNFSNISPEEERNLLIILQPCDALNGVISKEVDRRASGKCSTEILNGMKVLQIGQKALIIKQDEIIAGQKYMKAELIKEIRLSKEEILNALYKQTELIIEIKELNEKQLEQLRESIIEEFENDINKTQEKEKIDKWEKEKKLISYGLTIIDFVANVIQIYSAVQGGQHEAAMNQGISLVGRCIERIRRG